MRDRVKHVYNSIEPKFWDVDAWEKRGRSGETMALIVAHLETACAHNIIARVLEEDEGISR